MRIFDLIRRDCDFTVTARRFVFMASVRIFDLIRRDCDKSPAWFIKTGLLT